ncbi:MAG: 30S ribosomal protein S13 [Candidatus Altiarchaeota archaeon]
MAEEEKKAEETKASKEKPEVNEAPKIPEEKPKAAEAPKVQEEKPEVAEASKAQEEKPKIEESKPKADEVSAVKKEEPKTSKPEKKIAKTGQEKTSAVEEEKPEETDENFQHRVRVGGVVLDGNLPLERALTKIKGVGPRISAAIRLSYKTDKKRIGEFSDSEIEELEKVLENIANRLPSWMVNRQKDPTSGKNLHFLGPELDMIHRDDINLMRRLKTYKGNRHSLNLPVRGQRTRTSFRKGTTIGVNRRKK